MNYRNSTGSVYDITEPRCYSSERWLYCERPPEAASPKHGVTHRRISYATGAGTHSHPHRHRGRRVSGGGFTAETNLSPKLKLSVSALSCVVAGTTQLGLVRKSVFRPTSLQTSVVTTCVDILNYLGTKRHYFWKVFHCPQYYNLGLLWTRKRNNVLKHISSALMCATSFILSNLALCHFVHVFRKLWSRTDYICDWRRVKSIKVS